MIPAACVLVAAALAPFPLAAAQVQGLPRDVVEATSVGDSQREQIERHVAASLALLESGNPGEIKRGRDALLEPLKSRGVTVAFRQAYGERLAPDLVRMASHERDELAINSLRIAGELATAGAADVMESSLSEERTAVRYAAVAAMGRTFEAMTVASPAMTAERALAMVDRLSQQFAKEQHPSVLDVTVRSLGAAIRMERREHAAVRATALRALTEGASARLRQMGVGPGDDAMMSVLLRAGMTARDAITVNNPALQLDAAGERRAVELAGHAVGYAVRNVNQLQERPTELQETVGKLLAVSEATIAAGAARQSSAFPQQNLAGEFGKGTGGARSFFQRGVTVIQWLHAAPYSFAPGTFLSPDQANGGGGPP